MLCILFNFWNIKIFSIIVNALISMYQILSEKLHLLYPNNIIILKGKFIFLLCDKSLSKGFTPFLAWHF